MFRLSIYRRQSPTRGGMLTSGKSWHTRENRVTCPRRVSIWRQPMSDDPVRDTASQPLHSHGWYFCTHPPSPLRAWVA